MGPEALACVYYVSKIQTTVFAVAEPKPRFLSKKCTQDSGPQLSHYDGARDSSAYKKCTQGACMLASALVVEPEARVLVCFEEMHPRSRIQGPRGPAMMKP